MVGSEFKVGILNGTACVRRPPEGGDPPPVWPHKDGMVRGIGVEPLYKSAPEEALSDPALYEILALLDALRLGRARERQLAAHFIEDRLK